MGCAKGDTFSRSYFSCRPGAIGWIVSIALIGDALVPLATGALSDRFGIVSLQPL